MSSAKGKHRRCRVVGYCLYDSPKCPSAKRAYPPGVHGKRLQRRGSDYARQLLEKQKLRDTYRMKENQFLRFFKMASRKKGITGDALLTFLESRLDNIVYRSGFARTIFGARQLVNHGYILVNNKRVTIPSYIVKPNTKISLAEKAKKNTNVQETIEINKKKPTLPYIQLEEDGLSGVFTGIENVADIPNKVEISQVVELYSK